MFLLRKVYYFISAKYVCYQITCCYYTQVKHILERTFPYKQRKSTGQDPLVSGIGDQRFEPIHASRSKFASYVKHPYLKPIVQTNRLSAFPRIL